MNTKLAMMAGAILLACGQGAYAANELITLGKSGPGNNAVVTLDGNQNRLTIDQANTGGASNHISVFIDGDLNGGPLNASFSSLAQANGLAPGALVQNGFDNSMAFKVVGSHNIFAAAQLGNNNTIDAFVSGSYNEASVMQVGEGNVASLSQTGIGNIVSISQTSF